jgi:hypothetical protein
MFSGKIICRLQVASKNSVLQQKIQGLSQQNNPVCIDDNCTCVSPVYLNGEFIAPGPTAQFVFLMLRSQNECRP